MAYIEEKNEGVEKKDIIEWEVLLLQKNMKCSKWKYT